MTFRVRADVPYGNVADAAVRRDGRTTVIEFAAHPHGGPEAMWFCFRIERTGRSAGRSRLKLLLKHVGNLLGGLAPGVPDALRPVIRQDGGDWRRLPAGAAEPAPDGRLRLAWLVDAPARHTDVALCYPYGAPEVERLVADCGGYWRADAIAVSQAGRPLVRLSNDPGQPEGRRPGLYLLARQHSGETPGSWVLDGLLRRLAANPGPAPLVWCVPLSNIDGVEQGDYGKDNFPWDLNRAWGNPPMRYEVLALQRDMRLWAARCKPALAADFHAPAVGESDGMYAFLPRGQTVVPATGRWAAMGRTLAAALGADASDRFLRVAGYASRWDGAATFQRFCAEALAVPLAVSLETPYGHIRGRPLERDGYRAAGARLADALAGLAAGRRAGRGTRAAPEV